MPNQAAPKDLPKMEYRRLGRSGLQVSAISLGGWITYGAQVNDGSFHHHCDASSPHYLIERLMANSLTRQNL